jgi:hypothetical protein
MTQAPTDEAEVKAAETAQAEVPLARAKVAEVADRGTSDDTEAAETQPPNGDSSLAEQGSQKQNIGARKVQKQTNIQTKKYVGQQILQFLLGENKADETPKDEEEDPTESLLAKPTDADLEGRGQLLVEWISSRIIVLSSFQSQPALAAAYSLVHDPSFCDHEKRTLLLGKTKHSDLTIDLFTKPKLLERQRQIVLVEIERTSPFLDSILQIGHNHARSVQELLRQRESLLICTASAEVLELGPDQRLPSSFPFSHHSVPFLPYLLERKFPPQRARELQDLILAQLRRGLWESLSELYEQIDALLIEGAERLEEVIRQNETSPNGISLRQSQNVKPAEVFREDSGVHGAALYTAVYFPDLTPHDFARVVLLLLGEQTRAEEAEEQILTEKEEVRTLKRKVEKRLADLWSEAPDRFLRECHLRAKTLSQGTHVMDFSYLYLRREMKAYLESAHPMFLVRMFERLQVSGLLFDPNASSELVDNLIHLFVERTLSDPSFCSKDWLFGLMIGLQSQTTIEIESEVAPDERIFLLLARLGNEWIRRHFIGRLAQLIREMLQHDPLRDVVRNFLSTLLFAPQQQHVALSLLLELTRRLRFAPHFDSLLWLRRLIDQGAPEVRLRTFQCLVGLALESGSRVFEFLEALRPWLPSADLEIERYSLSSRSVLRLLLEYTVATLTNFDLKHFGQWPSRFPLFAAAPEDENLLQSRLDLLCEWLLHRGIPAILESGEGECLNSETEWRVWFKGPEEAHGALVADLVEQWILVLEGFEPRPPHPGACRVIDKLLAVLARRADPVQRKRLIRRWQERQQQCYVDVNQMPVEKREERNRLLATRKKLYELRQRFLSACPGGTSSEG